MGKEKDPPTPHAEEELQTKPKQNRVAIYVALFVALLIGVALFLFFKGRETKLETKIEELSGKIEAYQAIEEMRLERWDSLETVVDGIKTRQEVTENNISRMDNSLTTIIYRNEKVRDSIRNLPFDKRLFIFATNLSEISDTTKWR